MIYWITVISGGSIRYGKLPISVGRSSKDREVYSPRTTIGG
jgi:hypothetical protein